MAEYNRRTKKITGAEKGTLVYFHEMRHAWQDKLKILDIADQLYYFAAGLTIFFLIAYPHLPYIAVIPIGVHYALMVAIELDAWIYALSHEESRYSG